MHFCRQIHMCARIGVLGGWGVQPFLEMPGFSRILLGKPFPYRALNPYECEPPTLSVAVRSRKWNVVELFWNFSDIFDRKWKAKERGRVPTRGWESSINGNQTLILQLWSGIRMIYFNFTNNLFSRLAYWRWLLCWFPQSVPSATTPTGTVRQNPK